MIAYIDLGLICTATPSHMIFEMVASQCYVLLLQVACQELGYTDGYFFEGLRIYNPAGGVHWIGELNCQGHEMSIWNCPHTSFPYLDGKINGNAELFCSNPGMFSSVESSVSFSIHGHCIMKDKSKATYSYLQFTNDSHFCDLNLWIIVTSVNWTYKS